METDYTSKLDFKKRKIKNERKKKKQEVNGRTIIRIEIENKL